MGDALLANSRLTYEEYESLESTARDQRYEFNEGEIWSMAGETTAHNQIVQNIAFFLRGRFHLRGCRVFVETIRLEVIAQRKYYYPDVMLTCSERDLADPRQMHEPVVVVEVLSDSTESKVLGKKVDAYLSVSTLYAYIIVSQKEYWVRVHIRRNDFWTLQTYEGVGHNIELPQLNLVIPIGEIYTDINF